MKTTELMNTELVTCKPGDTLNDAARLMWEHDCGFLVVTGEDNDELQGVLTDRDICMAAYTRGAPLTEIPVDATMNKGVTAVAPGDDVAKVHAAMRERQVRRIPVVDGGRVVGVVSLNDLALAAKQARKKDQALQEVGDTLESICQHRQAARA